MAKRPVRAQKLQRTATKLATKCRKLKSLQAQQQKQICCLEDEICKCKKDCASCCKPARRKKR